MISEKNRKQLLSNHPKADLSLYKELLYNKGWSGYSDHRHLIVLVGIDDCFYVYKSSSGGGYSSPSWEEEENLTTYEVNAEDAFALIEEMDNYLREDNE